MSYTASAFGTGQAFNNLADDARKATTAAFDAMSNWRHELNATTERNSDAVFDKMASAAKAMGWPAEFMDMSRQNMMSASKMQMQMMDQVMDTWQKQITNPGAAFQMPSWPAFPGMPSFGSSGAASRPSSSPGSASPFPGFDMGAMGAMPAMVPLQFWMQAAEMWQKNWQQAMSSWTDAQSNMSGRPGGGSAPNPSKSGGPTPR